MHALVGESMIRQLGQVSRPPHKLPGHQWTTLACPPLVSHNYFGNVHINSTLLIVTVTAHSLGMLPQEQQLRLFNG